VKCVKCLLTDKPTRLVEFAGDDGLPVAICPDCERGLIACEECEDVLAEDPGELEWVREDEGDRENPPSDLYLCISCAPKYRA